MAFPKSMISRSQVYLELLDFIWLERFRLYETFAKLSTQYVVSNHELIASHLRSWATQSAAEELTNTAQRTTMNI